MAEQYTITGIINPSNGAERAGVRVQVLDRDLPSLERRIGTAPLMLGEAVADDEGRFQITYVLEQFRRGEGIPGFRRSREKHADLSFRVFDRSGKSLTIREIEALERAFRSDQIIFNAPPSLEVSIFVDAVQDGGASEYEQLVAFIEPVVEDLPLEVLSDEDVAFLSNELGLEQQRDVQQRIEWLRRCMVLAQETALPAEAYYGWGRKDIPAQLSELAATPMDRLQTVLEKVASYSDDELRRALRAAIEENIIPARILERAGAIAAAGRRRAMTAVTVRLRLEAEPEGGALPGYTITSFDSDENDRDLGTDVTDPSGEFTVEYFVAASAEEDAERSLRFRVRGPGIDQAVDVAQSIRPKADAAVPVRVPLPDTRPALRHLNQGNRFGIPDGVLQTLEEAHGIRRFADIRRRGGLDRIPALREVDAAAIRRLDTLADLDRLTSDVDEIAALLAQHFAGVAEIAETPLSEFISTISMNGKRIAERRATELHVAATAQTDLLNQLLAGIAADVAIGMRPFAAFVDGDYVPPFPPNEH